MPAYDLCCPTAAAYTVQAPGILGPLIATSVAEYRLRGITLGAGRATSALRGHISLSALIGGKGGVSEASDDTGGSKGSERQPDGLSGGFRVEMIIGGGMVVGDTCRLQEGQRRIAT